MPAIIPTEITWYQLKTSRRGKKVSLNLSLALAGRMYWWLITAETKTWSSAVLVGKQLYKACLGKRQTWSINVVFVKQLKYLSWKYHEILKSLHFRFHSLFFSIYCKKMKNDLHKYYHKLVGYNLVKTFCLTLAMHFKNIELHCQVSLFSWWQIMIENQK